MPGNSVDVDNIASAIINFLVKKDLIENIPTGAPLTSLQQDRAKQRLEDLKKYIKSETNDGQTSITLALTDLFEFVKQQERRSSSFNLLNSTNFILPTSLFSGISLFASFALFIYLPTSEEHASHIGFHTYYPDGEHNELSPAEKELIFRLAMLCLLVGGPSALISFIGFMDRIRCDKQSKPKIKALSECIQELEADIKPAISQNLEQEETQQNIVFKINRTRAQSHGRRWSHFREAQSETPQPSGQDTNTATSTGTPGLGSKS